MNTRLDLHLILTDILGSEAVYFQPPESFKLSFPCIVYSKSSIEAKYANNKLYFKKKRYMITVIDSNPDSPIPDSILELPLCKFDRFYVDNNLNHNVYSLYF